MKIEVDYAGGDEERNEIAEDFVAPIQTTTTAVLTPKKLEKKKRTTKSAHGKEKPAGGFSAAYKRSATGARSAPRVTRKERPSKVSSKRKATRAKKPLTLVLIITLIFLTTASGVFTLLYASGAFLPAQVYYNHAPDVEPAKSYSTLTGEELNVTSDEEAKAMNEKPTFCVQIPNGLDGARPQVGLNKTAVVFEAIAEAGITRFAAVFQPGVSTLDPKSTNPITADTVAVTTSTANATMIGPIRSLRSYYLDWDTPFDCTIVHAGGSPDAIAAVSQGYRDLSESTTFMWRDRSDYSAPNNLFTSSALLTKFNSTKKYATSNFKAFPRLTPDEEAESLAKAEDDPASEQAQNSASAQTQNPNTTQNSTPDKTRDSAVSSSDTIKSIKVNFGSVPAFNTVWTYNSATNSYLRAYATGAKHETYTCNEESAVSSSENTTTKKSSTTPTIKSCQKEQVKTKNIAVMIVKQATRAGDKKLRTDIATVGSGKAYIFKDGKAIKATWEKKSKAAQITFKDSTGNEIAFNPGRLWIQAVPTTGSIKY